MGVVASSPNQQPAYKGTYSVNIYFTGDGETERYRIPQGTACASGKIFARRKTPPEPTAMHGRPVERNTPVTSSSA